MVIENLSAIQEEHLEGLVKSQVPESETLEYKERINLKVTESKVELLRDISSFANWKGGDFVVGVREKEGKPDGIVAAQDFNRDSLERELNQLCSAHLDPSLLGLQLKEVPLKVGGSAFVIRIPKSLSGPHRVKHDDDRFFIRCGNAKRVMSTHEIRTAIHGAESFKQKLSEFRTARLKAIKRRQTTVRAASGALVVIHLVPLSESMDHCEIDLRLLERSGATFHARPISSEGGCRVSYNYEGYLCWREGKEEYTDSYLQVFRNGSVECVDRLLLVPGGDGEKRIRHSIEASIAKAVSNYLRLLHDCWMDPPYSVSISMLDIRDYFIDQDLSLGLLGARRVDRDDLEFPAHLFNSIEADCYAVLKPTFDMLWQTCGYEGSRNYTPRGVRRVSAKPGAAVDTASSGIVFRSWWSALRNVMKKLLFLSKNGN